MKEATTIAFDKTGTLFTRINKIEEYKIMSETYPEAKIWEIIALIEKELRHPLAEVLYKEAFTRCEVVGTNYGFILIDKPVVQKEGITAKILYKAEKKEIPILIGNKNILKNHGIPVPKFYKESEASTELFLTAGEEVLIVSY